MRAVMYNVWGAAAGLLLAAILVHKNGSTAQALFSAILSATSIGLGFLLTFYVYLISAESKLLKTLRGQSVYELMKSVIWRAVTLSAILCCATIAMIAVDLKVSPQSATAGGVFVIWGMLTGVALASTLRCIMLFRKLLV